ncbi:MAG: hypothetical protein ACRD3D_05715 [Terriglobia bacterium]
MVNPLGPLNVLREWKPGDTRQLTERALRQARIDGHFDSYNQVYDLDGRRWKVTSQMSQATGETFSTLVCVN